MKYFGTDGFRGEANRTLDVDQAYKIGRIVGWHFTEGATKDAKIVMGRDTRQSSNMFESAIAAGLMASGADVYILGVIPTPSVSFSIRNTGFDAGVMITASHNPFHDNGIKLVNSKGYKMEEEVLEIVESYIDGEMEIGLATDEHIGTKKFWQEGRDNYLDHLKEVASGLDLKGMKIGLDCANGASSEIAAQAFSVTGADITVINNEPNGRNINVDCGSTHIEALSELVKNNNLDCGFAFDGDCDRCIAVDGEGNEVNGDKILYLCGKDLASKGLLPDNMIVATVMANIGFGKAVEAAGLNAKYTDVGDKYVFAEMVEHGYVLGGEQSGHVIYTDCEVTGDGIVTALKTLHATSDKDMSFTEQANEMREYPQLLVNVRVSDKQAALSDANVQAAIDKVSEELGDDGRCFVRASGTEPLIRVLCEAGSDEICERCCEAVAEQLRKI